MYTKRNMKEKNNSFFSIYYTYRAKTKIPVVGGE